MFQINQKVRYRGKKAIIADHLKGKYLLWDETGSQELKMNGEPLDWIPGGELESGWDSLPQLEKKYEKLPSLVGVDGNAFMLMGHFKKHAQKNGWAPEDIQAVLDEAKSRDYNHLVFTLSRFTD